MKKLYFYNGKATLQEVADPAPLADWVLVRTHYSFISAGTERQTLSNQAQGLVSRFVQKLSVNSAKIWQSLSKNGVLSTFYQLKGAARQFVESGYACSGQVIWADENSGFLPGDFVACAGAGFAGHAEIVAVPKNLTVKLSDAAELKNASATAVAAVAMQGLRQADCAFGETLVVFGLGLVGLLTVQLAKLAGLKVVGIDTQQTRLELAKQLGCDHTFLANDLTAASSIKFLTVQHGADAAIVCVGGSTNILDAALNLVRHKACVVVVGDVPLNFSRGDFYQKEVTVKASCSYGPGRYNEAFEQQGLDFPYSLVRWTEKQNLQLCVELISQNKLQIAPLISQEFVFADAPQAFAALQSSSVLSAVLTFQPATALVQKMPPVKSDAAQTSCVAKKGKINVVIVGVGGFAKTCLLPEVLSISSVNIAALVDTNANNLLNVATQFGVSKRFDNLEEALAATAVDAVVICSPHGLHAQQALSALHSGKAVFVEKPPAVTLAQLDELNDFFANNTEAFYCVDFNRSFSPYFKQLAAAVRQRATPLVVDYRVNAGFLASSHWVFKPENNGRIIGEACHMLEFLLALTGSEFQTISVNAVAGAANQGKDNFVASMNFTDGSQASLVYTSLGSQAQDKERVEIFWQGRSVLLTDFAKLQGFGMPLLFNKTSYTQEKGHRQILRHFFAALKNGDANSLMAQRQRALDATYAAILIKDLVDQGGGFVTLADLQKQASPVAATQQTQV